MTKIHFEMVSRYDKKGEPARIAIPFRRGELWPEEEAAGIVRAVAETGAAAECRRMTAAGGPGPEACPSGRTEFPSQQRVTARWDDGSVKWLLVYFLADLPANQSTDYEFIPSLEAGQRDLGKISPEAGVELLPLCDGRLGIRNGEIEMSLSGPGETQIFSSLQTRAGGWGPEAVTGPVLKQPDGTEFTLRIGDSGWEILESGPVYGLVRARGKHCAQDGTTWLDYSLMIHIWAGKPWLNLDYQVINAEDDPFADGRTVMELNNEQAGLKYDKDYPRELLREIRLTVHPLRGQNLPPGPVTHKVLTSGFNYRADCGDENRSIEKMITADTIVNTANEMFPEVMFSVFAGDWNDGSQAFGAGIYQAYQNFPKAMVTDRDGAGLFLLPDIGKPLELPQGVARTSRFYLFFHDPGMDERMVMDRALMMEMPAVPVLEPSVYMAAGVFDRLVSDQYCRRTERFLYRYVDSRAKGLGMLHFGDGPEWEYMKQGRSGGDIIWINNEYDMPHNFMIMLARSGDRRYFDYLKAAAEHWYDVDFCHYSNRPYRQGLLCTHSVNHVSGQPVPSHQWVEGFLDYYHLTGNPNGLETAMAIGNGLLQMMELPLYKRTATVEPREIGWAMRTFVALYKETYEDRWLEACRDIVEIYIRWQEELGTWTTPYPDHYMDRVPFMIHVGIAGLYQYYGLRPEPRIKATLLAVIDDMVRECYSPLTDMFYGKQFPGVRYQNLNGMVLESLAIAYELTDDRGYIEKGLGMFEWISVENQPPIYDFSKYKHDDYTVIYNCPTGPKRCAQSLLPFLHYYRYAVQLGILDC